MTVESNSINKVSPQRHASRQKLVQPKLQVFTQSTAASASSKLAGFGQSIRTETSLTGHDWQAWRQFQLDAVANCSIVVLDAFMPVEISEMITTPNKDDGKFVPSG